jgi:hypothetical protein
LHWDAKAEELMDWLKKSFKAQPKILKEATGDLKISEALFDLRARPEINCRFWRGEDKAAKEGEADILLIRRCSLTLAAVAGARQNGKLFSDGS